MHCQELRRELRDYYENMGDQRAAKFCETCVGEMDRQYRDDMSIWEMKRLQYDTISSMCDPVLFVHSPFYYEMGTMAGTF